jgi:hypothetical protein
LHCNQEAKDQKEKSIHLDCYSTEKEMSETEMRMVQKNGIASYRSPDIASFFLFAEREIIPAWPDAVAA